MQNHRLHRVDVRAHTLAFSVETRQKYRSHIAQYYLERRHYRSFSQQSQSVLLGETAALLRDEIRMLENASS